jgi:hypothetical protein
MPTRGFERIALAQLLVAGCAVMFGLIGSCTSAADYKSAARSPATDLQSIQSQHRASTKLHAFNTTHTFNTKHRSKW